MEFGIGAIVEGKVTGITKFGAFVSLPDGRSGLVHISEITNAYVNDVHDYLSEGQTVKVKILSLTEAGKLNLSIKQASPPPAAETAAPRRSAPPKAPAKAPASPARKGAAWPPDGNAVHGPSNDASFEDKLKHFMQESDSRMSDSRIYSDRRSSRRRK